MKFARELDQDAVPEWKAKYLNYKQAKKKLKAITSALRDLNRTPLAPSIRSNTFSTPPAGTGTGLLLDAASKPRSKKNVANRQPNDSEETEVERSGDSKERASSKTRSTIDTKKEDPKRRTSSEPLFDEHERQKGHRVPRQGIVRYGSIIGSPPKHDEAPLASLQLPAPAINAANSQRRRPSKVVRIPDPKARIDGDEPSPSAYEAGKTRLPGFSGVTFRKGNPFTHQTRSWDRSRFRRLLSISDRGQSPAARSDRDLPLDVYHEFEHAQDEFFLYLDGQLEKIEDFYQQKEKEATERFEVLKEQLHILRDRRIADLNKVNRETRHTGDAIGQGIASDSEDLVSKASSSAIFAAVDRAWNTAINGRVGRQTKVMESETTPEAFRPIDGRRDYERRAHDIDIPYRTAKRKLKLALQEYYRSLELIKSYTMLNRTAFRKITKKYDKAVNPRPTGRYMSEKVGKAHFIKSDLIDGYITSVEDLYSRYFEAGNHKVAANKLRKASRQRQYHGGAMFRNGLTIMFGSVLGVQGLAAAGQLLYNDDAIVVLQTSFLLQIYAGYFFITFLMLLFCLACQFWSRSKVNYVFIFEFETHYHLDWRQLLEIPCLCWALLGFFIWINFERYGNHDMYIYFPLILIATTLVILCCPFPIIYWKARLWLLNACWRLFFSGLYPVEFRDFFLGDMFCSLTYSMGNIELFFCLYVNNWENPSMCNSSNSRLLGFFSTLPGIWRALQCLRRYWDTRNAFPHLANCGKYTFTIFFYMSLSLYRIHKNNHLFAFFIFCGAVNSVYCSVWDLIMDWSLLNPYAKKRFLRNTLAYHQTWIYYAAIVIDPILRMNWIFYAIFAKDIQHSALLSFFVSFSEICRRGMWIIFRVENEHCTNVGRFRASRDVPLPFNLSSPETPAALEEGLSAIVSRTGTSAAATTTTAPDTPAGAVSIGTHVTPATTSGSQQQSTPSLRRRRGQPSPLLTRIGSIIHMAHAQDFERRKKDEDVVDASKASGFGIVDDDDDDDDDDEDGESTDDELQAVASLAGSDIEQGASAEAGLGTVRRLRDKGKRHGEASQS